MLAIRLQSVIVLCIMGKLNIAFVLVEFVSRCTNTTEKYVTFR